MAGDTDMSDTTAETIQDIPVEVFEMFTALLDMTDLRTCQLVSRSFQVLMAKEIERRDILRTLHDFTKGPRLNQSLAKWAQRTGPGWTQMPECERWMVDNVLERYDSSKGDYTRSDPMALVTTSQMTDATKGNRHDVHVQVRKVEGRSVEPPFDQLEQLTIDRLFLSASPHWMWKFGTLQGGSGLNAREIVQVVRSPLEATDILRSFVREGGPGLSRLQRTPASRTLPSPACTRNVVAVLSMVAAMQTGQPVTLYICPSGSSDKVTEKTMLAAYREEIRKKLQEGVRPSRYTQKGMDAALKSFNVVPVLGNEDDLYGRRLVDDDKADRYMYMKETRAVWEELEAAKGTTSSREDFIAHIRQVRSAYTTMKQEQWESWLEILASIDGIP